MNGTQTQTTTLQQSFHGKLIGYVGVYTLFYSILAGAAHSILIKAHLGLVNNIPGILGFALTGTYFLQAFMRREVNRFMVFLVLFMLFYVVYAFGMNLSLVQTAMGFYIWGYFIVGVLVAVYEKEQAVLKYLPVLWCIAVIGVLLNYFVEFPWVGDTYEVAGTTMQASRDWAADGGMARLAGFSRISSAASAQILIACLYMMVSRRYSAFVKTMIFFTSFVAITLTTSKTEMALLALFPFFLGTYRWLQWRWAGMNGAFNFARAITVVWVLLIVAMPLGLSTHKQAKLTGPMYGFITADTILERMTQMWPEAFDLLDDNGNRWFGRGIGGIGTGLGMQIPQPEDVNTADNMFVYVFVECGAFGAIPFLLGYVLNHKNIYRRNKRYFETFWAIGFAVLGVSLMEASVEDSFTAIFMGILLARGYITPRHVEDFAIADSRA